MSSPLSETPLFQLGPVPVAESVFTSFAITVVLGTTAWLLTRRLSLRPTGPQAVLEALVGFVDAQVRDVVRRDPAPFTPLVGTLAVYLLVANSLDVVPLLHSPTSRLETAMALAGIVFLAVPFYGIRAHGVRGYLSHFVKPTPLLAPIHLLSEGTRTLSLMMRLVGNEMSHGLVLAVILSIAGLLVPVPVMAFGLLVGVVQAYIFSILATVYVGAAVEGEDDSHEVTA